MVAGCQGRVRSQVPSRSAGWHGICKADQRGGTCSSSLGARVEHRCHGPEHVSILRLQRTENNEEQVSAVHEAMDQESERLGPKQRRSCELGPDSLHKRKQRRSHDGRNTSGFAIIRSVRHQNEAADQPRMFEDTEAKLRRLKCRVARGTSDQVGRSTYWRRRTGACRARSKGPCQTEKSHRNH